MPQHDFRSQRLYVDAPLAQGASVALDRDQANYLGNVLRLSSGAKILAFNGRDGEWQAEIAGRKRPEALTIVEQTREQDHLGDVTYVFALLKHARLDYIVQKAVEMGAAKLQPLTTRHTQTSRVNLERMSANVIEAAEQCGILRVPEVAEPMAFERVAAETDRLLVFCDEDAGIADPVAALSPARSGGLVGALPVSLLIGPEGGFAEDERGALLKRGNIARIALGPRILRADTAAVAALAVVQAVLGDWA